MQLSKRMQKLASMVTKGNRLADVGTDHGYIPIALVMEKKIPSAIAMDVNQGPLKRASEHIRTYGLDTYIETRLSDGLEKLKYKEADTVLIAGMGGQLTRRILMNGSHCLDSVKELILQPQSEIYLVREWLVQNGFRIETEDIVAEDGKYYPMMKAVHGKSGPMSGAKLHYGAAACQRSFPVLEEYLQREAYKNDRIMEQLCMNGQKESGRMQELVEKKMRLEEALKELAAVEYRKKEEQE